MTTSVSSEASPLDALERIASELGAIEIAEEARTVAARVHERRFFVACLGQFKRGKSTLLNALVDAAVLPVGVTPVTAVVTVLRHGTATFARVRIGQEPWRRIELGELAAYVSEAENPENAKNVTGVEVFVPSALLASGLCLVDTPGIGSVFEGNTEATRAFVPHIDAALVVLGAEPPISGDELRLVETVAKDVRDFVFVLAKADRLRDDERSQANTITEGVLKKIAPTAGLLEVSAIEKIAHGIPTRDWLRLTEALTALAGTRGAELVAAAERRAIGRVAASLEREIAERRAALLRPGEESARRLTALRTSVKQAEKLLADAGPLFAAVEARLATRLEREREAFLVSARPSANRALEEAAAEIAGAKGGQKRAIEAAQRIAREHVEGWRLRSAPAAERMYADAVAELVEAATGVLKQIAQAGDPALAGIAAGVEVDTRFRVPPHFYFTEILTLSGRSLGTADHARTFRPAANSAWSGLLARSPVPQDGPSLRAEGPDVRPRRGRLRRSRDGSLTCPVDAPLGAIIPWATGCTAGRHVARVKPAIVGAITAVPAAIETATRLARGASVSRQLRRARESTVIARPYCHAPDAEPRDAGHRIGDEHRRFWLRSRRGERRSARRQFDLCEDEERSQDG
jgi:hypothetical protein